MALAVLDLDKAIEFSQADFAGGQYSQDELDLMQGLQYRRQQYWSDQQAFAAACDRWDSLYYPPDEAMLPLKGASHWWYHSSATAPGRPMSPSTHRPSTSISRPPYRPWPHREHRPDHRLRGGPRRSPRMGERLYTAWKR